jgi:hypothetical protein
MPYDLCHTDTIWYATYQAIWLAGLLAFIHPPQSRRSSSAAPSDSRGYDADSMEQTSDTVSDSVL